MVGIMNGGIMNGGMDPEGLPQWSSRRPGSGAHRPPHRPPVTSHARSALSSRRAASAARRGTARSGAVAARREGHDVAREIVSSLESQGFGPHNTFVPPEDTRTVWNPDTHGEMVIYWHRIFKYSFKTLFMIVGTNSYVAPFAGALTVGQLFGTLDKLLLTIVSVVIGSTCSGIATYTGAAAATIALYTLIKGAYDSVPRSREDVQVNVAAQCRSVDEHTRRHVIEAGQELMGLFNSPGFLELVTKMNSGVDFASGAFAGLLTSKFIRRTYKPPLLPPGSSPDVDPWTFALARRFSRPAEAAQGTINLFDKWGAVSIPVIFPVDKIEEEEEGRTRTMAFINMGRGVLSFPQQFQAERELSVLNLKIEDLRKAFHRCGIPGDVRAILGEYLIEGLYEYLKEREIDLETVLPDDLISEVNTFVGVWEASREGETIPQDMGRARDQLLQQQALEPEPEMQP